VVPNRSGRRLFTPPILITLTLFVAAACALVVPGLAFAATEPTVSEAPTDPGSMELAASADQAAASTVLVTLPWGQGDDQVGLFRTKEGLTRGPEALAIAPDGRMAVLDSINQRLLLLDQTGHVTGKIQVPLAAPRFLALDDGMLYVLDADVDRQLTSFTWSGELATVVTLPPLADVVTALFATSEGACVEVAHQTAFLLSGSFHLSASENSTGTAPAPDCELAGRPLDRELQRVVQVTYSAEQGVRVRSGEVGTSDLTVSNVTESAPLIASGRSIEHLVSVDSDGRGGLVIGARLLQPEVQGDVSCSLVLTRLAMDGSGLGSAPGLSTASSQDQTLLLAESDFAYLGQPYVVAPDGRVIQPVGSEAGYTVLVHSFSEVQP
jgi:hypothetical protein